MALFVRKLRGKETNVKNKKRPMRFTKVATHITILVSTLTLVCLLIPSIAFAETPGNDNQNSNYIISESKSYTLAEEDSNITIKGSWGDRKVIHLRGKGTLKANGDGVCRIKGRTDDVEDGIITISGNGVLLIRDLEGDLEKKVSGYGGLVEIRKDFWLYYGFNGKAEIKGSGFVVNIFGSNIDLYAKGRGVAFLAGDGTYTVERDIVTQDINL